MFRSISAALLALLLPLGVAEAATKVTLHEFLGGADGDGPSAILTLDASGAVFGATRRGGSGGHGLVYRLNPPATGQTQWGYDVLHAFLGRADGSDPVGNLALGSKGTLYGATMVGGTYEDGSVFELRPPAAGQTAWTSKPLHGFAMSNDGALPWAGVTRGGGKLYGTTSSDMGLGGCGAVFELSPPAAGTKAWTEKVVHAFGGGSLGCTPTTGIVRDRAGHLYGTTLRGTVYHLIPPATVGGAWSGELVYPTSPFDPKFTPSSLLIDSYGRLFGTTTDGGAGGKGIVYALVPPVSAGGMWSPQVLHSFLGGAAGDRPNSLVLGRFGRLYGTTVAGGAADKGTVFQLTPPTKAGEPWRKTILHSFRGGIDGEGASGLALGADGALYGTTAGGRHGKGTVFRITP